MRETFRRRSLASKYNIKMVLGVRFEGVRLLKVPQYKMSSHGFVKM